MARTDPKVLTPDMLDRISDLHARGYGRNAICRELGLAAGTVTKACQDLGLSFDREATKVAVQVRKTTAAAIRSELELQLLEKAQAIVSRIEQPMEYRQYGGKDFVLRKWTQALPDPVDQLKMAQAAGNLIDRSSRLAEMDRGSEIAGAASTLQQLVTQLGIVVGDYDPGIAS